MKEDYGVVYNDNDQPLVRVLSKDNLKEGQYYFDIKTGEYTFCDPILDAYRDIRICCKPDAKNFKDFKCKDCGVEKILSVFSKDFDLMDQNQLCMDCLAKRFPEGVYG